MAEPTDEYTGALAKRRMVHGHTVTKKENGTTFSIKCTCGWVYATLTAFREQAEHAAWLHITTPTVIIPGSSDVLTAARRARAQQREDELKRQLRLW